MATLFEMEPLGESGLKLNEAQRRAITHGKGPLLVIAGAGTGKTRVITERIRHLLQADENLSGENILGLTFTKKAAGEMKARVVKATGDRGKAVTLATFHSFSETLLKEVEADRRALEQVDHWILLRRNLARLKLDKYRRLAEPGQFLSDFIQFFSRCQDELVSSEDYQRYVDGLTAKLEAEHALLDEDTFKERVELVAQQQEISRVYRASEELLRAKNAVALNGLIAEAVALLKQDAGLRAKLQERFKHILVDEFEDTNIAQLELLHVLSAELLEFLSNQRKTLKRRTAREILSDLMEWLEVPQRAGTQDRKYVNQLSEFVKDWEPKSETRGLPEFLEYLDYFEQAGGTLSLEDDAPGDAVQLMTVHGAKKDVRKLQSLCGVNQGAFPARNRSPLCEFPTALMKEALPQGDFHIQEERRLFYVALTRAEQRLKITALTEKKGKVPTFIEDIVMEPAVKRRDVIQTAPKVRAAEAASAGTPTAGKPNAQLFPVSAAPP